jgi:hypothetical protein
MLWDVLKTEGLICVWIFSKSLTYLVLPAFFTPTAQVERFILSKPAFLTESSIPILWKMSNQLNCCDFSYFAGPVLQEMRTQSLSE